MQIYAGGDVAFQGRAVQGFAEFIFEHTPATSSESGHDVLRRLKTYRTDSALRWEAD